MDKVIKVHYEIQVEIAKLVRSYYGDKDLCRMFLQQVSEYSGLSVTYIKSPSRVREVVRARQLAIYIVHRYTGLSLKTIGMEFGGRDHTTVIHACNSVLDHLDTKDPYTYEFITEFEAIVSKLYPLRNKKLLTK